MSATTIPLATGPGQQLHQARVAAGLSIEDVARSLQLSARHIGAIERDDYEQLPAATYVRGYLRGYAQLLGIAPEQVIDSFNRLPVANRRHGLVPPAPAPQVTSNDNLIKLGTLAVAGIVLGLAVVWWQGQEPATEPAAPAVPPVALAPEAESVPAPAPVESAPEPVTPPQPAPSAPRATAPEKPVERVAPPVPAPVREAPVVDIDPNAPRARLVLYVSEDSWADVRDARDQRLIYETVAAGRVVTLDGVPPFHVFLGNAEGVRVELNGRDYDVLRHKRGQVARFTVGQRAAAP